MIREATLVDLPALLEMGRAMLEEAPNFAAAPFSRDRLAESLVALIEAPTALVAIAEIEKVPAGVMVAGVTPHWASEILEAAELALFVHQRFRGVGIATALIERFVEFASDHGAEIVRAGASAGICDEAVIKLYQRAGFKVSGACLQL